MIDIAGIDIRAVMLIVVVSLVTIGLRFLPFFIFGGDRTTPEFISYLGKVLPFAIMGMLVVYCLKGISFAAAPFGVPELLAVLVVAALHLWKRNTLISIVGGTACYMVLVQLIF